MAFGFSDPAFRGGFRRTFDGKQRRNDPVGRRAFGGGDEGRRVRGFVSYLPVRREVMVMTRKTVVGIGAIEMSAGFPKGSARIEPADRDPRGRRNLRNRFGIVMVMMMVVTMFSMNVRTRKYRVLAAGIATARRPARTVPVPVVVMVVMVMMIRVVFPYARGYDYRVGGTRAISGEIDHSGAMDVGGEHVLYDFPSFRAFLRSVFPLSEGLVQYPLRVPGMILLERRGGLSGQPGTGCHVRGGNDLEG